MRALLAIPLLALTMSACTTKPVEFNTLLAGQDGGDLAKSAYYEVIVDASAYRKLFERLTANRVPKPAAPDVDFEHSRVLFVYMGSQPTTGYGVEVASMERDGSAILARLRFRRPGPQDLNAFVVTQPYALIRFPRISGAERLEIRDDEDGRVLRVIPLAN